MFYVDLVTLVLIWRHRSVAMHATHKTVHSFSAVHDPDRPTQNVACQFQHQNQLIHIIVIFKHNMHGNITVKYYYGIDLYINS